MLSYPLDEAETLLTSKLAAATQSHSNCEEDLEFLREQITVRNHPSSPVPTAELTSDVMNQTMEVAVARVYNWDVVQKRKEKAEEDRKGTGSKDGDDQPNG
jgi:hypothetical protein